MVVIIKSISDMLSFMMRAARCEPIHCQVAVKEEGFSLLLFEELLLLLVNLFNLWKIIDLQLLAK
uniref:Uncharacterized protein n=2 Tax=Arundo donax TaxID=35708 RepID=A0A0A9DI77_ARUDO